MSEFSALQQIALVGLRFILGWHLFYQGLGKLRAVSWTSQGYLEGARGPFEGLFGWIAQSPGLLAFADAATIWGLMITGLLLMVGLFSRLAALAGFFLVLSFYLAMPPLTQQGFTVPTAEGYELYVNKTLIEALALLTLAFFKTGLMAGLDVLLHNWRSSSRSDSMAPLPDAVGTRQIPMEKMEQR